ncbi:MAG: SGNH/GDSL hydrolase family protein [Clostridia bacterium]|jgi:lysophospholipase L1-like esterase
MSLINKNETVLFQGDSITDTNWDRSNDKFIGYGYPTIVSAWYSSLYPENNVRFLNRGISGNRIGDLLKRVQKDFIDIEPSWVSIMIGINDCWHRYSHNIPTSAGEFERGYRDLLTKITQNTNAKLVLCEPFLLEVEPEQEKWREDLDPKIDVVRKMSKEFETLLVPLDGIFREAGKKSSKEFWSEDGVHPTSAGHGLIARAWLTTMGII